MTDSYFLFQSTCQQTGTIKACDMWPVPESHQHPIYFPTSGHGKSGIEYGLCLNHTGASNLPANKRVPASASAASTTASASRINLPSGLAEKFAETGLLVSSDAGPMAWPDPVWLGLVWFGPIQSDSVRGLPDAWPVRYPACQGMACQKHETGGDRVRDSVGCVGVNVNVGGAGVVCRFAGV